MKKILQTALVSAIMATSGFASTKTIEGYETWERGSVATIGSGNTLDIRTGTISNYTNFEIKDYQEGDTTTVNLISDNMDGTIVAEGKFQNMSEITELKENSSPVSDKELSGTEHNISIGSVNSKITFKKVIFYVNGDAPNSTEDTTIDPATLEFDGTSVASGDILNLVSQNSEITTGTVTLNCTDLGGISADLATLTTEGSTYSPQKIKINLGSNANISGDCENVTVPVLITGSGYFKKIKSQSGNFPNADVTIDDGININFGENGAITHDFVVNQSLTLGNGTVLGVSYGSTLTIKSGATLRL